ncbi:MAG: hypothetical protein ABI488_22505 [Polyangiaceae bacterium]
MSFEFNTRCPTPTHTLHRLVRVLGAAFALLALSGVASAQAYLADLPTPAQVEVAAQGSDPVDTLVQQSEALGQMCWVIRVMSAGGEMGHQETPAEVAKCAEYDKEQHALSKRNAALTAGLPKFGKQSWVLRSQHYQNDSFRSDLVANFPKLKADYDAKQHANTMQGLSQETQSVTGNRWFTPIALCASAVLLFVLGVGMVIAAARMSAGPKAGSNTEHTIVRSIDGVASRLAPADPSVVVEQLCIGAIDHLFSYNAPTTVSVSGGTATVTGGGARSSSYMTYDFGYAVHNRSRNTVRVKATLAEIDQQGYSHEKCEAGADLAPGEKRRIWFKLGCRENLDFGRYVLSEFGLAPVLGDPRNRVVFTAATTPNVRLYDAFNLQSAPLASAKVGAAAALSGAGLRWAAMLPILLSVLLGLLGWISLSALLHLLCGSLNPPRPAGACAAVVNPCCPES